MGTRLSGGERQWVPLGYNYWRCQGPWQDLSLPEAERKRLHDEHAARETARMRAEVDASVAAQEALAKLKEEHATRDVRHAEYLRTLADYEASRQAWLAWWLALSDAQRVRVAMQTDGPELARVADKKTIVAPAVGRRLRNLAFRFRVVEVGPREFQFRDYGYQETEIEIIKLLLVEGFGQ